MPITSGNEHCQQHNDGSQHDLRGSPEIGDPVNDLSQKSALLLLIFRI